jgi:hypothetical protein
MLAVRRVDMGVAVRLARGPAADQQPLSARQGLDGVVVLGRLRKIDMEPVAVNAVMDAEVVGAVRPILRKAAVVRGASVIGAR